MKYQIIYLFCSWGLLFNLYAFKPQLRPGLLTVFAVLDGKMWRQKKYWMWSKSAGMSTAALLEALVDLLCHWGEVGHGPESGCTRHYRDPRRTFICTHTLKTHLSTSRPQNAQTHYCAPPEPLTTVRSLPRSPDNTGRLRLCKSIKNRPCITPGALVLACRSWSRLQQRLFGGSIIYTTLV